MNLDSLSKSNRVATEIIDRVVATEEDVTCTGCRLALATHVVPSFRKLTNNPDAATAWQVDIHRGEGRQA